MQYPGLKEEYYLSDFEPDASLLERFGVEPERVLVVLRPPPDVSLYHRHSNPLFPMTLDHLGRLEDVHAFVLPRTEEQREYVRSLSLPSVILPETAVDAQSLIALADVVVSAGGTMNREAAALGVPVYTTYGGRLGGVDEELIREGRLKPLTDPRALDLHKRERGPAGERVRRDPQLMLELLLSRLACHSNPAMMRHSEIAVQAARFLTWANLTGARRRRRSISADRPARCRRPPRFLCDSTSDRRAGRQWLGLAGI